MLKLIEETMDEVLPKLAERPTALAEAMRYAVGAGGKRVRPLVCLYSSLAVGGCVEDAKYPAVAIELLHNYTLVHDDLPAMDNDIERRGHPTVWKKFGEANAILAGDALLALAYRVAARAPRNVAEIIDVLGKHGVGVVQGQVEDIAAECARKSPSASSATPPPTGTAPHVSAATPPPTPHPFIYIHKTSDLFIAAAKMGGLAGGGCAKDIEALERFALNLGLAFQYEDDLLDGDGLYDRETTTKFAESTTAAAIAALDELPGETGPLRTLAKRLIGRTV